jgi:sortase A
MPLLPNDMASRGRALLLWIERLLLAVGLLCLGVVAYAVIDARWFELRQGQALDDALRARAAAERAAGKTAAGQGQGRPASETDRLDSFHPAAPAAPPPQPPPEGSLLGRLEIPRVGISSLVLEGIAGSTLRRGIGHIPGTALPQPAGNVGLAGHRDSVFRGLKDIEKGDLITIETLDGTFHYSVDWARVVDPGDVAVLQASGRPELTLVTCFPFYYVGSAPERFVVRGHLLGGAPPANGPAAPADLRPVPHRAAQRSR